MLTDSKRGHGRSGVRGDRDLRQAHGRALPPRDQGGDRDLA